MPCTAKRSFSSSDGNAKPTKRVSEVNLIEVGPRDGLQNQSNVWSVDERVELCRLLEDAGCRELEVGSFVSPTAVPAMANTDKVLQALSGKSRYTCLTPNLQGFSRAVAAGVHEVAVFISASEGFSARNLRSTIEESMKHVRQVVEAAAQHHLPVRAYLSCVVECPYDGPVHAADVAKWSETLLEAGCYQVSLGDTLGVGTPRHMDQLLGEMRQSVTTDLDKAFAVHFHDTYGQGLVNVYAALQHGIRTVDTAVAGLGGCPYCPGAAGNVATEDVVYMLHGMGIHTGVHMDGLLRATEYVQDRQASFADTNVASRAGNALMARKRKKERGRNEK